MPLSSRDWTIVIVFCMVFLNISKGQTPNNPDYRGASCDGPKTVRSCNAYNKGTYWLPVEKRIEFKILLIAYKTIHGQSAEDYLKALIEMYQPSRTLRSSSCSLLCPQKAKTENYGCRAFSFVAPKLLNSLPEDIKITKTVIFF